MENQKELFREIARTFFEAKGVDLGTREGLRKAKAFLKTATWDETFLNPADPNRTPEDEEVERRIGGMRLYALRVAVDDLLASA